MAGRNAHSPGEGVWFLARRQHGVVARAQLRELGLSDAAIEHRLAIGRLHLVRRGVYAVGRPGLGQIGRWMAAVLCCGPGAMLSHKSAAAAWKIRREWRGAITVSVPDGYSSRTPGLRVHRRKNIPTSRIAQVSGVPVTDPVMTLVDLAATLAPDELEAAVNEADKLDLVDPKALRRGLEEMSGYRGVARLRHCVDRHSFVFTDSALERRFLPIARAAGLPAPQTRRRVEGFVADFLWPDLALVVETDGLRYHRTPAQQARDRLRDQAYARAGLTSLRFTHAQVWFDPAEVRRTLAAVAARLAPAGVLTWEP